MKNTLRMDEPEAPKRGKKEPPDPEKDAAYKQARKEALGVNKSVYARDGRNPNGSTLNRAINAHANAQDLAIIPAHATFHQKNIDALRRYRESLGYEPNEKTAAERRSARENRAERDERMRESGITRDWRKGEAADAKEKEGMARAKDEGMPYIHTRTSGEKAKWGPRSTARVFHPDVSSARRREVSKLEPSKYTDLVHGLIPAGLAPSSAIGVSVSHRMHGGKSIGHLIDSRYGYLQN